MVTVEEFLFLIGVIILMGFLGSFLFEKLRVPDVLLLLAAGVLIGHWLGPNARQLASLFAPYFGALAIIMILFEGGLALDYADVVGQFRRAFILGFVTFVISVIGVAWVAHIWLEWSWMSSLMFGVIIGCTSSAIIIPTVQRVRASESGRAIVTMESILSDTLAIVAMAILLDISASLHFDPTAPLHHLLMDVGIAIAVSVPVGIIWLNVLDWTKVRPLSYLWTFAMLVLVYAGVHWLGGSGELAVFSLALLIGNSSHLPRRLFFKKIFHTDPDLVEELSLQTVHWFHTELTFLIRSFFFVYIGLLLQPGSMRGPYLYGTLIFTSVLMLARGIGVCFSGTKKEEVSRGLLWAFLPRGLTSAVLAVMPAAFGSTATEPFLEFTIPVILSTNIIMTFLLVIREWRRQLAGDTEPVDLKSEDVDNKWRPEGY